MFCSAKTRDGTPCKSTELLCGGRCRLHGGLSTGPKTLEGKRVSARNIGKDYDELVRIRREKQRSEYYARACARPRVNPSYNEYKKWDIFSDISTENSSFFTVPPKS